jgi:hypothetical protein
MRLRLLISTVATMGVLLHAALLVRHSLTMADAAPASDLPNLPQPSDPEGCPVCAGLVAAFAVLGPQAIVQRAEPATDTRLPGIAFATLPSRRAAHPPARGPPASA